MVDLGCGIGADSLALAALERTVTAVERDPVPAAVATVNLTGWPRARVVCADAQSLDLDALESESSQLIVRAYRTGAFTQKRLAELAGISQQRVSQLLAR